MTNPKMSPAALARCKSMRVSPVEDSVQTLIEVMDPKFNGKVVARQTVRTKTDVARYVLAWRKSHNIPAENISRLDLAKETQHGDARDNVETCEVHSPEETGKA